MNTIWIETGREEHVEALARNLGSFRTHVSRVCTTPRVEVAVDREFNALLSALVEATEQWLAREGAEAVSFLIGHRSYRIPGSPRQQPVN